MELRKQYTEQEMVNTDIQDMVYTNRCTRDGKYRCIRHGIYTDRCTRDGIDRYTREGILRQMYKRRLKVSTAVQEVV